MASAVKDGAPRVVFVHEARSEHRLERVRARAAKDTFVAAGFIGGDSGQFSQQTVKALGSEPFRQHGRVRDATVQHGCLLALAVHCRSDRGRQFRAAAGAGRFTHGRGEAVAPPRHRLDIRRAVWLRAERFAKREHVLREVGLVDERVGPERLDQLGLRQDTVRIRDQKP